jgi:hypothetical protein
MLAVWLMFTVMVKAKGGHRSDRSGLKILRSGLLQRRET